MWIFDLKSSMEQPSLNSPNGYPSTPRRSMDKHPYTLETYWISMDKWKVIHVINGALSVCPTRSCVTLLDGKKASHPDGA